MCSTWRLIIPIAMLLESQQSWRVSSYSCISDGVVHLCLTGNLAGDEAMRILKIAHAILFGFLLLYVRLADVFPFRFYFSVQVRVVDHAVF